MGVEYELKFRAEPAVLEQVRSMISGQEQLYRMQTTYYDTPTGQLSGRRYTLRRRLENGISVCTLKIPEVGAGRCEWEIPCDDITDAIPLLIEAGAPAQLTELTGEGIIEVCGARFDRITKTVEMNGSIMELALDRGVLTGGGRELPLCEIEVELKEGTRETCDLYAAALAKHFGLEMEHFSKFRRALALAKGV